MLPPKLARYYRDVQSRYFHLTEENFARTLLLYYGLNNKAQHSFPDHFTHYELIFTVPRLSSLPVLTLLNPNSPFQLIETEEVGKHALLYDHQFVDYILDYEQRLFDFRKKEPFYFYVTEINGDLVLKLNPVQLCDFFQNAKGMMPCGFCFRNDMVQRFTNVTAEELIQQLWAEEKERDNLDTLMKIDEISVVTGSYKTDDQYIEQICELIGGIKPKIRSDLRVVVGSHEGKGREGFEALKTAGVTVFAFPIESMDDRIRQTEMKNRKGLIPIDEIMDDVKDAAEIFGADGVIIRLVAGMGDKLDDAFEEKIKMLASLPQGIPYFNINQYMPFTHYHWRMFEKARPYDLDYMFTFFEILNRYVPVERQMRFKVSP